MDTIEKKKNTSTSRRGSCSLALLTQPTSGDVTSADCFNNMTGSRSGLNFNCGAVSGAIGETQNCFFSVMEGPEEGTSHTNAQSQWQFICNLASRPRPASTSHLLLPSVRQSDDDSNCAAHANGSPCSAGGEKVGYQIGLTVIQFTKQGMNR